MVDSLQTDIEYLALISSRLKNFKKKDAYLYEFSCPICGDSKRSQTKARGYFYKYSKAHCLIFKCHNHGGSMSFGKFLKFFDSDLYRQYLFTLFPKRQSDEPDFTSNVSEKFQGKFLIDLPAISGLPDTHATKTYLSSRGIPKDSWGSLYYSENISKWLKEKYDKSFSGRLPDPTKTDPRIIIPIRDLAGNLIGLQARTIDPKNKLRYLTTKFIDNVHLIFGLEKINFREKIWIVEGPFDSLFLPNCLAAMTSSLHVPANILVEKYGVAKSDVVLIFDNEPRNKEVVHLMEKAVEDGWTTCVFPSGFLYKDINEMISHGVDIVSTIQQRMFSGMFAKLEMSRWRKI